ncbi:hypothetical protein F4825DRAFT_60163 [Nemania diffusa]|nr:hypothetical protein F4825DRAFT_60163 [Nemania diffusa]
MQACCDPNEDIVNMLLKRDPDTTVTNYHGLTALGLACVNNRLNHVKALIAKGAKTMYFDREGLTPIRIALRRANIEIALELLASEDYYPRNLAAKPRSGSQKDDNVEIENKLLEHFKFEPLEKLHVVMYWAVSNDALELVRRCIDHNQEVLRWSREGDTWLHIASDNGALRIVELLLDKVTKKPEQTAEWATAEAIMRQDNAGDSALTISIDRRHDELQNLFWTKIRPLRDTGVAFVKMYSAAADWILELLARYEKPGHEDILKEFLQGWYDEEIKNPELDNALHWAIKRRKVVVVWWLLSKGGYSSRCAIESAQKLVPGPYKPNEICGYIRDLLLHPPPLLDYIPNPNKDHIPSFEVGASTAEDAALNPPGNIVDILSDRKSIGIRYAQSSIHDIIYGAGPESVMKKAKEDLRQRDLNALRNALRQMVPKQGENGHKPSADDSSIPDWMKSLSSQQDKDDQEEATDGTSRDLLVRWIHLPVNELHLMRDLVSRLSYDSKRSEIDHMALMKHFNRSWSELAAGAERYYMKPQCVQQSKQTEHGDHSNQNLSGGDMLRGYNGCMALYMPYLTIGSYIHGARKLITPKPKALDESNSSRNSRRIKHTPLTLDQYYYPTIIDSSERDNDQVLSKFLQRRHGQPSPNGEKKILMVNQLWVWIIDEKTIITATTGDSDQYSRRSLDQENTGSLLEATLRNVLYNEAGSLFEGATSVYSIMELILGVATGLFVEKSVVIPNQTSKDPIEVFRESIRDVANQETSLFREFLDGLRREARAKQGEPPDQKLDYKPQAILNRYHVISSETELLDAIRDIRDELHMLRSLAEDQEDVWQQAFASQHLGNESQRFDFHTPTEIKKDLDAMLLEADKIESYINALLDLRQAEFGRLQAQDSAQLSNVILVLTVITIVFLPLSFLSSLFALDVSTFPHQGDNLRYPGWWLFPILFGVSTIVSVPAIALAWNVNAILAKFRARNNAEPAKLPVENSWNDIKHDDTALQHTRSKGWRKSLRRRLPNKENIDIP